MNQIVESIKTVEDRNRLLSEIELVLEAIYKEGELEKLLSSQVSRILADYVGNQRSWEIISEKLLELKKDLDDLAVVKLTLAFEASESTIEKIIIFIRQNFSEKTILDIGFEPKILGGIIFEYGGLYKDYTLKTKLEEVFKSKREELFGSMNQEARIKEDKTMIHNS